MLVSVEEGWDSDDHLENQDTQGPPINREVVSISNEHLRCQIFGCSAEGVSKFALLNELGETEVSHKQVA